MSESSSTESTPSRQKMRDFEVEVLEAIRETPDSTTLVLDVGGEARDYLPGQFIFVKPHQFSILQPYIQYFEDAKGSKEPPRAYSLYSAPHEPVISFTIKEEKYVSGQTKYPPLLSPVLTYQVHAGQRMVVNGYGGPYFLPLDIDQRTDHVLHICAGSGSVPNLSMIKHIFHHGLKVRQTFLYGNKTYDDIIYREELERLVAQHPGKLEVIHAISRDPEIESRGPGYVKGRVTEELIRKHIPDPDAVEVFTCGPGITKWDREAAREKGEKPTPRFLETVLEALEAIGVPKKKVHREAFG